MYTERILKKLSNTKPNEDVMGKDEQLKVGQILEGELMRKPCSENENNDDNLITCKFVYNARGH